MTDPDDSTASYPPRPSLVEQMAGYAAACTPVTSLKVDGWAPSGISVTTASSGDVLCRPPFERYAKDTSGAGRSWRDPVKARSVAIYETLERRANFIYTPEDFVAGRAADLDAPALDLDDVPRPSATQLRDQRCRIRPASKEARIRWCPGIDLHTGRPCYVPAVMTYLLHELWTGERFCRPFSTGSAVHQTMTAALLGGICEVVERDASMITWLQKLPLPLLDAQSLPTACREIMAWCGERGIDTYLFDSTTDLGVPTVLCLLVTPGSTRSAQLMTSAADLDHGEAAMKALLECICWRAMPHVHEAPPRRYDRQSTIHDGAVTMARPGKLRAFRFLLDDLGSRPRTYREPLAAETPERGLSTVLDLLKRADQPAYAVDITSTECLAAGIVGARAVLPRLVPMTLTRYDQYRGTPRLYQAPAAMGYRVLSERALNSYPYR